MWHAHGHVRATWHARTCALRLCMPCMPDGLEAGRACPGQPAHANCCMPALGMVSLDTVVRVSGAGRAGDAPKHISSRSAHAQQMCLRWAVRAGMGMLPPDPNSPRRSFTCPLGCAMAGGRSGGCESVLIHRFHPLHTARAYTCHTTNRPMILRGLVRRPGTTIYRARSPSPLARTIALFRATAIGLVVTGVLWPTFAVTTVFLECAGAGRARFATFLRSADCTALPDGGPNCSNPSLWPQNSPLENPGFHHWAYCTCAPSSPTSVSPSTAKC